jgi:FkbM family methyltransferase
VQRLEKADRRIVRFARFRMKSDQSMVKQLIKKIIQFIPAGLQTSFWAAWHRVSPPKIWIYDFVPQGCVFEAPTRMERYRITHFGDEVEFMSMTLAEIQKGDVFYDIGACLGMYAIHAAKKGAQVTAFEPDPNYHRRLRRNIKLNKLTREIKVINWAVSNRQDEIQLFTDGIDGRSASLVMVGERGSVKVRTNSIDTALKSGELPAPDVIKMDIEGAEMLALQGMRELLTSSHAPRLVFVEIHPSFLEKFGSSAGECQRLFEEIGYVVEKSFVRSNQIQSMYRRKVV